MLLFLKAITFFLREIVDDIYGTFGIKNIFFAFKDNLGRALDKKEKLDFLKFGKDYVDLWQEYRLKEVDINLSNTNIHSISLYPCSMPYPNYSISPNGKISSCTLTFNEENSHTAFFEIGAIGDNEIRINSKTIHKLRQFNILNMFDCRNCFAKWHCRGGCPYAKQGDWFVSLDSDLCDLIRMVVKMKLISVIMSGNSE